MGNKYVWKEKDLYQDPLITFFFGRGGGVGGLEREIGGSKSESEEHHKFKRHNALFHQVNLTNSVTSLIQLDNTTNIYLVVLLFHQAVYVRINRDIQSHDTM